MELNSLRSSSVSPTGVGLGFEGTIGPAASAAAANAGGAGAAGGDATAGPRGLLNNPLAKVGVEYGKTLWESKTATQLSAGLGGWLRQTRLRGYFRVSQAVVLRKIGKMLLPYPHREWARVQLDETDAGLLAAGAAEGRAAEASFASAKEDVNAPDLYVGLMAFFTFVVAIGFAQGSEGQFSPESFGLTATRSFVCLLFELGLVYGAFYLADAPHSPSVLDLLSLLMAQFVALTLGVFCGVLFGRVVFWMLFFALALSTAVYTMRTLQGWLPTTAAALSGSAAVSSPRFRSMLGVSALLQLACALFLVWPALSAVHSSRGLNFGGLAELTRSETSSGGIAPVNEGPTPIFHTSGPPVVKTEAPTTHEPIQSVLPPEEATPAAGDVPVAESVPDTKPSEPARVSAVPEPAPRRPVKPEEAPRAAAPAASRRRGGAGRLAEKGAGKPASAAAPGGR